jgi:membrane-associated HD superfamily phosphohydrolase
MFKARKKTKRVRAEKVKPARKWAQAPEILANPVEKVLLVVLYTVGVILLISDWPVSWAEFIGASALVTVTHFLFACYIVRFQRVVFLDIGRFILVLVMVLLTIGFVRMTVALDWWSPFFIPISFVGVILAIVFNQRFAVEMMGILLLYMGICLYGYDDLLRIMVTLFAGSLTGILLSGGIRKRSKLVNVGVLIGVVHVLMLASLSLYSNEISSSAAISRDLVRGLLHGVVVGFLLTGILPFIEVLIGTVTEISLLELSNQNE